METLESIKSRLKSAVGGNTDDAMSEIEKELRPDSKLYSEFLICKNKNNAINSDYYKGVIADGERGLRQSKLLVSVLDLIDRFEQKDLVSFRDRLPSAAASPRKKSPDGVRGGGAKPPARKPSETPPALTGFLTGSLSRRPRLAVIAASVIVTTIIIAAIFLMPAALPMLVRRGAQAAPAEENKLPPPAASYIPSDFEIIERKSILDFRAWRRVPINLMKTDRFEPMIWHQSMRIEKKGDSKVFIVTHWSDAYTLDIACISHECVKRPPVAEATKDGAAKYRLFQVEFDVSKYVVNEQFTIEYQTIYWNAYQKTEAESVAVIARNPTRLITFEIYFPESVHDDLIFRHARREENVNYVKFENPDAVYKNKHLVWRIPNPSLDIFYGVQWKWKT